VRSFSLKGLWSSDEYAAVDAPMTLIQVDVFISYRELPPQEYQAQAREAGLLVLRVML
jgi:hypothetical protein